MRGQLTLIVLALLVRGTYAQEVSQAPIPLRMRSAVPIQGAAQGFSVLMVPLKCDAEGDVYLRGYQLSDLLAAPLTKVSADGTKRVEFNLRKVQGFDKAEIYDFAVGIHGDVYFLASTTLTERRIARFSDAGEFESSVVVDAPFTPQKLAVFPSGQFFVAGEELVEKTSTPTGTPFTAIIDDSGRIVARLHLTGDVGSSNPSVSKTADSKKTDAQNDLTEQQQKDLTAIELGAVFIPEDGNAYLMRTTTPPVVYVVDAAGNQVRKLEIQPPDKGFEVVTFKVAYGKIVTEFERKKQNSSGGEELLSVADTQTGTREIDYALTPEVDGLFACYTPNFFLFVGQHEGHLAIKKAGP